MESVYGTMKDLANKATIKCELGELQAELEQIRQQLVSSQDQPLREEANSLPNPEHRRSIDSEKLPPSTQLENLQRLLAKSRGDE